MSGAAEREASVKKEKKTRGKKNDSFDVSHRSGAARRKQKQRRCETAGRAAGAETSSA